ncbi:MAG: hypothetical protein M1820_008080 [Bogoriella megaspora]|nr:MAG: hypothetical protein M1820_008080 [Bogoriella megaspora]
MGPTYDALVIGAGPAGLTVALGLGRVHRTAAVFSNDKFRNDGAHAAHTMLSRDHVPPSEIRKAGVKDIEKYKNTTYFSTTITKITRTTFEHFPGFIAEDQNGKQYSGRSVVLAMGSSDVFPSDIAGYSDNWPRNIYQCPFCDGHERGHLPKGILVSSGFHPMFQMVASMFQRMGGSASAPPNFSKDVSSEPLPPVTIFTNGNEPNMSDDATVNAIETATALGMNFDKRKIAKLIPATSEGRPVKSQYDDECSGVNIVFEDGSHTNVGFLFHKPPTIPNGQSIISSLGIETVETQFGTDSKRVEPFGGTSVPGVFVCGDISGPFKSLNTANYHGGMAAAGLAHYLTAEDDKIALARWKEKRVSEVKVPAEDVAQKKKIIVEQREFKPLLVFTLLSLSAVVQSQLNCQQGTPQEKTLDNVRTSRTSVPNSPFGIVYSPHGNIAFVSLDHSLANSTLGVLDTSTFPPQLIHQIPLPPAYIREEGALGITITNDGRHVLIAAGPGIIVVDASLAAAGSPSAVISTFNGTTSTQNPGFEATEITLSADNSYAFVSQEYGANPGFTTGNIDVFKLHQTLPNGRLTGHPVGTLNLGYAVVGTALSPSGQYLYAVSETSTANDTTPGTLSVISTSLLETSPSNALLSSTTVPGCSPVRVLPSSSGEVIWTTARESNLLLAFNASLLLTSPNSSLISSTVVGQSPVGLTLVRNETRILTADSNRFGVANATTGVSVVDVEMALEGREGAVLGRVETGGGFPRELGVSPDGGTVLVADYASGEVQAVDVGSLP